VRPEVVALGTTGGGEPVVDLVDQIRTGGRGDRDGDQGQGGDDHRHSGQQARPK
jgi:hypothetical protein